ncbi:MAG TPA: hypothetical protein VIV06_05990 [Candidatus Limnocylindrales bacterium]
MKGDRVEAVVDTGNGTQTFEIVARKAGRRLEVTTARGVVEVSEVTRTGQVVRTGRFMASRLIALVEYPALEGDGANVEVTTRRRLRAPADESRPVRRGQAAHEGARAGLAAGVHSPAEPGPDLGLLGGPAAAGPSSNEASEAPPEGEPPAT